MGGPTTKDKKGAVAPLRYGPGATRTLVVSVVDPARKRAGVAGVTVEVVGLNLKTTGADGKATFKDLPIERSFIDPMHQDSAEGVKEWTVFIRKEGYGPPPPAGLPWRVWQADRKPVPTGDPTTSVEVEMTSPKADITITVVDGKDGKKGLPGANVEVWGLRGGRLADGKSAPGSDTGPDGKVTWKGVALVKPDGTGLTELYVKVNKQGYGLYSEGRWVEAEVQKVVTVTADQAAVTETVPMFVKDLSAAAKLERIGCTQASLAGAPGNTRRESSSTSEDLGVNAPVVFLCGGGPVRFTLKAEGRDWGQGFNPAKWDVKVHKDSPTKTRPSLEPLGDHADLATGVPGIFSVVAELGDKTCVLNVCLVKLEVTASHGEAFPSRKISFNFGDTKVFVNSAEGAKPSVPLTSATTPWLATWSVQLSGARDADYAKVVCAPIQNGTSDSYEAFYAWSGAECTCTEVLLHRPILDTFAKDTSSFYCTSGAMCFSGASPSALTTSGPPTLTGPARHFMLMDAPRVELPRKHEHAGSPIESIRGGTTFRVGVAAHSADSPGMVVVVGRLEWAVTIRCKIKDDLKEGSDDGSSVRSDGSFQTAGLPLDAVSAGFTLSQPRFVDTEKAVRFDSRCVPRCSKCPT